MVRVRILFQLNATHNKTYCHVLKQITGTVIIADFTGFSMGHLTHADLAAEKKLLPFWNV